MVRLVPGLAVLDVCMVPHVLLLLFPDLSVELLGSIVTSQGGCMASRLGSRLM